MPDSRRVLVVYNRPVLLAEHPEAVAERTVVETVGAVMDHLDRAGYSVECLEIGRDQQAAVELIQQRQPDVIFNLFEGFGDDPPTEHLALRQWEPLGIPITGNSARALRIANAKHQTKSVLNKAGLPTPQGVAIDRVPVDRCGLEFPLIVKPVTYHGSIGIEQASVVTSQAQLVARVEFLQANFQETVVVEQFLRGREFTIGVIEGPEVVALPIMEFEFNRDSGNLWPVVTFDAKWQPDSAEYQTTPIVHADRLPARLADQLRALACDAFRALECRDYARVDMRLNVAGQPHILEVNANPDLSPTACFSGALKIAHRDYGQFVVSLVERALTRPARPEP